MGGAFDLLVRFFLRFLNMMVLTFWKSRSSLVFIGFLNFQHAMNISGTSQLEQLVKWESLTNFTDISQAYYEMTSRCELGLNRKQLHRSIFVCADAIADKMDELKHSQTQWNRPSQYANPVCNYEIEQVHDVGNIGGTFEDLVLRLRIYQTECKERPKKAKGGTSFDVLSSSRTLEICNVKDNFDDTYDVSCHIESLKFLPHHDVSNGLRSTNVDAIHSHHPICANITITLDYEHFDAFVEQASFWGPKYDSLRKPMRHVLMDSKIFCEQHMVNKTTLLVHNDLSGHGRDPDGWGQIGYWVRRHNSQAVDLFNLSGPNVTYDQVLHNSRQYEWHWEHHTYSHAHSHAHQLSTPIFSSHISSGAQAVNYTQCLAREHIILVGESHMRFNWDYIVYHHSQDRGHFLAQFAEQHAEASWGSGPLSFREAFFTHGCATQLDLICDNVVMGVFKGNVTVVIQPGAWDSTFWTAQNFVYNPKSAKVVFDGIRALLDRGCAPQIRLVWMQQVPYPECQAWNPEGASHCSTIGGGRNNYKVAAMNAFFERELRRLGYPQLRVVRAFDMMAPRLRFGMWVCKSHFLCHCDGADTVMESPEGAAVARAVLRAACSGYH